MNNIWNSIPLEDYEQHMLHETVGQLQLLNHLTKMYLEATRPNTVLILGVAGGNGLEHIDKTITREVIGIDTNEKYLEETRMRYKELLPEIQLINVDLSDNEDEITKADLIWSALILEYINIEKCFQFISNNIKSNGHLVVTIQSNNGVQSVGRSGIESVNSVEQLFRLVEPYDLLIVAEKFGFLKVFEEENFLPDKKSMKTYHFIKNDEKNMS
jgi:2-polyprenyl-3-methyl-5-hydroxy-6-metoxy-1,4-benzoquinol methylase